MNRLPLQPEEAYKMLRKSIAVKYIQNVPDLMRMTPELLSHCRQYWSAEDIWVFDSCTEALKEYRDAN